MNEKKNKALPARPSLLQSDFDDQVWRRKNRALWDERELDAWRQRAKEYANAADPAAVLSDILLKGPIDFDAIFKRPTDMPDVDVDEEVWSLDPLVHAEDVAELAADYARPDQPQLEEHRSRLAELLENGLKVDDALRLLIDLGLSPGDSHRVWAERRSTLDLHFVAAARKYYVDEGTVEVDPEAVASLCDDVAKEGGGYVSAWIWVTVEDIGMTPDSGSEVAE